MDAPAVQVHLFAAARAAVGAGQVTALAGSLGEILDELTRRHPSFATVRPRCSYLVDGISTRDDRTEVPPGARLDILPPFAGG